MGNSLKGVVDVPVGDTTYSLLFDFNALIALEDATGIDPDAFVDLMKDEAALKARTLRSIMQAGLSEHHPEATETDAGRVITALGGRRAAYIVIVAACAAAFGWGSKAQQDEGRGPRKAGAKPGTGTGSTRAGAASASTPPTSGP